MADPLRRAKEMAAYNNKLYRQNWSTNAQFNRAEAQKNRDWQERMANSAHQREIKDLKAAGLNPVLSVTGGNGAPTGSGSAASAQQAPVDTSLPMAVIDMATAQLNNATRLQEMAMQTQSAQWIAQFQAQADLQRHQTPSGNTAFGQVAYAADRLANWLGYDSTYGALNDMFSATSGTDIDQLIDNLKNDRSVNGVYTDRKGGLKRVFKESANRKYGSALKSYYDARNSLLKMDRKGRGKTISNALSDLAKIVRKSSKKR